jgi:isopentenyl diphosphate isomerase/L-lactate dehydrogenase-like FMN-dependent dehydrogenase
VERALAILKSEIDRALGQLGCNSVADLKAELVRRV